VEVGSRRAGGGVMVASMARHVWGCVWAGEACGWSAMPTSAAGR
jgi:hypothetical protein